MTHHCKTINGYVFARLTANLRGGSDSAIKSVRPDLRDQNPNNEPTGNDLYPLPSNAAQCTEKGGTRDTMVLLVAACWLLLMTAMAAG